MLPDVVVYVPIIIYHFLLNPQYHYLSKNHYNFLKEIITCDLLPNIHFPDMPLYSLAHSKLNKQ